MCRGTEGRKARSEYESTWTVRRGSTRLDCLDGTGPHIKVGKDVDEGNSTEIM